MGDRWLTDLDDVLRSAGLHVREYGGWQSRGRGSGGYDSGRPTHVMVHHTASPRSWDGQKDADYIATGDEDAPLSNLYLDRTGLVWVIAAGATNTNGSGHDSWGGGVPDNSMNSYAIGVEAGNEGTGEPWPGVQQDAYVDIVQALKARYGIADKCVRGHFEWAPDRKIDPAGQSRYASGGASWDMAKFRSDCGGQPDPGPSPAPTPTEEDDVVWRVGKRENGAYFIGDGNKSQWVKDGEGDIGTQEASIRMAPGAVNVWRCIADSATDSNGGPKMVTTWTPGQAHDERQATSRTTSAPTNCCRSRVDLAAIFTGIAAIVTGVLGVTIAIREVRRRERRSAQSTIRDLEHDLNECQAENVNLHRYTHRLRTDMADGGLDPPDPP